MFGIRSGLKQALKGVVEDIKGRRVDAADPYVPASSPARPAPVVRPQPVAARPAAAPAPTSPDEAPVAAKPVAAPPAAEPVAARGEATPPEVEAAPPRPAEADRAAAESAKAEAARAEAEAARAAAEAEKAARSAAALAAKAEREAAKAAAKAAAEAEKAAAGPTSVAALAAAAAAGKVEKKVLHADMGSTDLDAYVARAKANGRDVASVKGGIGLNHAEDGTPFWGPVDNESSRAKAAGKLLTIDQFECISCGTCVEQTDKVYYLPDDGKATPIAQDGPMDLIQDAIDACPTTCISWATPEEAEERGLATGAEHAE